MKRNTCFLNMVLLDICFELGYDKLKFSQRIMLDYDWAQSEANGCSFWLKGLSPNVGLLHPLSPSLIMEGLNSTVSSSSFTVELLSSQLQLSCMVYSFFKTLVYILLGTLPSQPFCILISGFCLSKVFVLNILLTFYNCSFYYYFLQCFLVSLPCSMFFCKTLLHYYYEVSSLC